MTLTIDDSPELRARIVAFEQFDHEHRFRTMLDGDRMVYRCRCGETRDLDGGLL